MSAYVPRTVARDGASYRQGLVLGLTMAEVMLLLVFCLLIAAAALFARDHGLLDQTRRERDAAREEAALLKEQTQAMAAVINEARAIIAASGAPAGETPIAAAGGTPAIGDDWQDLVAARLAMRRLEGAGVTAGEAAEAGPFLAETRSLRAEGVSGREATEAVAGMRRLAAIARSRGLEAGDPAALTEALAGRGNGSHDWPPIINLSEAGGYFFETGRAELTPAFARALAEEIAPRLADIAAAYDVDVVEVVGHTDEQPMAPRASNLDRSLLEVLTDGGDVASLVPADNAGLGIARAVAVARLLEHDPRLKGLRVLPLSGAQLIDTGDRLTAGTVGDVKERRRIEIRVRRSQR